MKVCSTLGKIVSEKHAQEIEVRLSEVVQIASLKGMPLFCESSGIKILFP